MARQGTVLLIEDDAPLARSLTRMINAEGFEVVHVGSGAAAVDKVMNGSFEAVISDLNLPGASGVDVLNVVRAYDPDVPLVLMTGCPTVDTAIEAVSLGVLEYLVKPTPRDQLARVLVRAKEQRRAAVRRAKADEERLAAGTAHTLPALALPVAALDDRAVTRTTPTLRATFERALATLTVQLEPVAHGRTKKLLGFAARMSSAEETLTTEAALIAAAGRLDRLEDLRRRVRELAVEELETAPEDALLFVDVHPAELQESDLYSPQPALARVAHRVVLQVRARELDFDDLSARASVLRFVGFRLAIADLDGEQASLARIAELSPEFAKITPALVRGLEGSAPRARLVGALVAMCRSLDAVAVAEGVSTAEECAALLAAGCEVVQGSLVQRHVPSPRRPSVRDTR